MELPSLSILTCPVKINEPSLSQASPGVAESASQGGMVAATDAIFRSLFKHGPEAMVLTSAQDGKIIEVNDEWTELTGFSHQEVLGRTALALGLWPDSLGTMDVVLASLKTGGRVRDVPPL